MEESLLCLVGEIGFSMWGEFSVKWRRDYVELEERL